MKVAIYFIGKPRDEAANRVAAEYVKRIGRFVSCDLREIQPERFDPWAKHPSAAKILLDPAGKALASLAPLFAAAERNGRDQIFLIGGAAGPPAGWSSKADLTLSLSTMTFSHELARAMLTEQIYRAFTVLRGHPYAK